MQSEKKRAYHREYKRRKRADPAWVGHVRERERKRLQGNAELRERKNKQQRERYAADAEYRKRSLADRSARRSKEVLHELWREKFGKWQKDYFDRHKDDDQWRHRRDWQRVKLFYGVDDPLLVEALALSRAAKRKMRESQ